jgi:hypothetical protein
MDHEYPFPVPYPPGTKVATAGFWFMDTCWTIHVWDEEILVVRCFHAKNGGELWLKKGIEGLLQKSAIPSQQTDNKIV